MGTNQDLAIERGHRLRHLRRLSRLSIVELAKLADISRVSISYWENAPPNKGLTRSGAEKLIVVFSSVGIECDIGWLWSGSGNPPHVKQQYIFPSVKRYKLQNMPQSQNFIFSLNKEIDDFQTMNKNAVITKIVDDFMLPVYEKGDIVGGIWQPIQKIIYPVNAILRINDLLIARKVSNEKKQLKISHYNFSLNEEFLFNENKIEFEFIAPIIRVWKY